MPITGYANTMRFCDGCGADLPRWVRLRLEELQDDKPALLDFGLERGDAPVRNAAARRRAGAALLHHQPGRPHAAAVEESRPACEGLRPRIANNSSLMESRCRPKADAGRGGSQRRRHRRYDQVCQGCSDCSARNGPYPWRTTFRSRRPGKRSASTRILEMFCGE